MHARRRPRLGLTARLDGCPRQDSNLRACLRRAPLYPLSYGGQGVAHPSAPPAPPNQPRPGPACTAGQRPTVPHYDWAHDPRRPGRPRLGLRHRPDRAHKLCLPKGYRVNVTVERPKNREHGDYATNVALTLAKAAHTPPRAVGEMLAAQLALSPAIAHAEVAGPGFVNITLDAAARARSPADRRRGRALRPGHEPARPLDQRRVHLGQPDRPDPPGAHPLGGGRRRDRPRPGRPGRRRRPGSSTSTTAACRWTGSASRS